MTQYTDEQQWEAASQRVAAKLQGFYDGITGDEQQVLALALHQSGAEADETTGDTSGHSMLMAGPLGPLVVVTVPVAVVIQQVRSLLSLQ